MAKERLESRFLFTAKTIPAPSPLSLEALMGLTVSARIGFKNKYAPISVGQRDKGVSHSYFMPSCHAPRGEEQEMFVNSTRDDLNGNNAG